MDRYNLYRCVTINNRTKDFVLELVQYYSKEDDAPVPTEEWDRLWSCYITDLLLMNREKDANYVKKLDAELKKGISKSTSLSDKIVDIIYDSAQTFVDQHVERPDVMPSIDELKRELVKGFFLFNNTIIDTSGYIEVFKNNIYDIDYIKRLTNAEKLIIYMPSSLRFSKHILADIEKYISLHKTCIIVCLSYHKIESNKLTVKPNGTFYTLTYNLKDFNVVDTTIPEFPWTKNYVPGFDELYKNLQFTLDEKNHWSVAKRDCKLGIVERTMGEYYNADCIADIYAEPARILCNEIGHKSPSDAWIDIIKENPRVKSMSPEEQRDIVYNRERGCNLFNAALAVYLLKRFAGEGANILDPTAGWGERGIASWITKANMFRSWDTNEKLEQVYKQQEEACEKVSGYKIDFKVTIGPFESSKELFETSYKELFDAVITSPPFFEQEEYEGTKTSTKLYPRFEEWNKSFYTPMLELCCKGLRSGGIIMAYLPSVMKGKEKTPMSMMLPIANKVVKRFGCNYIGSLGLIVNHGTVRETFVWRKKFSILRVKSNKIKKTIISYTDKIVGTFTLATEYFKDKKVTVLCNRRMYDIEVICYACGKNCTAVIERQCRFDFNPYGAKVKLVDSIDDYIPDDDDDAYLYYDGCNIPELLELTASKIKVEPADHVWCFDSPGIMSLMKVLYPEAVINCVTHRSEIEEGFVKVGAYYNSHNFDLDSGTKAHPMFDAKIMKVIGPEKPGNTVIWLNK